MVRHEYWAEIYPTDDFVNPWRVQVTETRNYKIIENVLLNSEEKVIEKINSYWNRYGRDKVMLGEHVYFVSPNPKFNFKGVVNE